MELDIFKQFKVFANIKLIIDREKISQTNKKKKTHIQTEQTHMNRCTALCWSGKFSWNARLVTLGDTLVAAACLRSLCSVNSGVTLRPGPSCVTAPALTHQSGAPNWYRPSLITAAAPPSPSSLALSIYLAPSLGTSKGLFWYERNGLSERRDFNDGMCCSPPCIRRGWWAGKGTLFGTTLCHKKKKKKKEVESIPPVLAYKQSKVCEMRKGALQAFVRNHHYNAARQWYNRCDRSGHKHLAGSVL